jgi:membrane-bound lytic murein transglycosylase B
VGRKKSKKRSKKRQPTAKKAAAPIATPAKPIDKSATPAPPPKGLLELGETPDDPLAAQALIHKALLISFFDAAKDPDLSARERRKEMRTIAASAAKVFPDARRWEATQMIKQHQAALDNAKARRGAKLEPVPPKKVDADPSA